jgi:hypothetical protein
MSLQLMEHGLAIAPVPRNADVSAAILSRFWEEAEQPAPVPIDRRPAPAAQSAPQRVRYAYD